MRQKKLTRAALLLALTITLQSLRLIIPVSPFFSTLPIGTLVKTCMLLALETCGVLPAIVIAIITPVAAFIQGMLPLPVFIIPVSAGNIIYLLLVYGLLRKNRIIAIVFAAICSSAVLFFSFYQLLKFLDIPAPMAGGLLFVMGWPQLLTGLLGGVLAERIFAKLILK